MAIKTMYTPTKKKNLSLHMDSSYPCIPSLRHTHSFRLNPYIVDRALLITNEKLGVSGLWENTKERRERKKNQHNGLLHLTFVRRVFYAYVQQPTIQLLYMYIYFQELT